MDKILFKKSDIKKKIEKISCEISDKYKEIDKVYVVFLLHGSLKFVSELFSTSLLSNRSKFVLIGLPVQSYIGCASHNIFCENLSILSILKDKDVLLIDDIYDTGKTLYFVIENIKKISPKSLKTCVLLEKGHIHEKEIDIDFSRLRVRRGSFPVGYGLDYNGFYRHLPNIVNIELQRR